MRHPLGRRLTPACNLVLITAALLPGCGGYGEISPRAYEYAAALYSICNRRDEGRLEEFSIRLNEARRTGQISDTEAQWLADIAGQAREGEWADASAEARRLLIDQVEGGP